MTVEKLMALVLILTAANNAICDRVTGAFRGQTLKPIGTRAPLVLAVAWWAGGKWLAHRWPMSWSCVWTLPAGWSCWLGVVTIVYGVVMFARTVHRDTRAGI